MAKTSHIQTPPELEEKYYSDLQSMDRFIIPRIKPKTGLLSKKRITAIASRSYLSQCAALWNNFTNEQKQAWKDVDPHFQKHGYRTFIADQCIRIKLGLEGVATPNQYHQGMVGKLLIEGEAEELKIKQLHPSSYWINYKVPGKDNMYEPVRITEPFSLPLKISISYKSDLTVTDGDGFARFYARTRHLYQGQNLSYDLIIDIPLQSNWNEEEVTISELPGQAVSYDLYIHLYKVTGTLLIDNVRAIHHALDFYADYGKRVYGTYKYAEWQGQNWARDPFCKKIEQSFDRGFYQILRHWTPIILPDGASYKSVYPE